MVPGPSQGEKKHNNSMKFWDRFHTSPFLLDFLTKKWPTVLGVEFFILLFICLFFFSGGGGAGEGWLVVYCNFIDPLILHPPMKMTMHLFWMHWRKWNARWNASLLNKKRFCPECNSKCNFRVLHTFRNKLIRNHFIINKNRWWTLSLNFVTFSQKQH